MDINRGDRFEYLVSMSSPALSLAAYRKEHLRPDDPRQKEVYRCGDLNASLIHTAKGRVITLEHNVSTPQPYDRINLIAGTKGIFRDYPPRIYRGRLRQGRIWADRPVQSALRASRTGSRSASWRASWAATAAWIS